MSLGAEYVLHRVCVVKILVLLKSDIDVKCEKQKSASSGEVKDVLVGKNSGVCAGIMAVMLSRNRKRVYGFFLARIEEVPFETDSV